MAGANALWWWLKATAVPRGCKDGSTKRSVLRVGFDGPWGLRTRRMDIFWIGLRPSACAAPSLMFEKGPRQSETPGKCPATPNVRAAAGGKCLCGATLADRSAKPAA